MYRDPTLTEKPALLEQRGGAFYSEAALGLVRSLVSGDGAVHVVDTRNGDTLAGLAADDVVEVPARVTAAGPEPLAAEAARARAPRPHAARRRLRAADRGRSGHARPGRRAQGAARAPADRPDRARGRAASTRLSRSRFGERAAARPSTAATRRRTSCSPIAKDASSRSCAARAARRTSSASKALSTGSRRS